MSSATTLVRPTARQDAGQAAPGLARRVWRYRPPKRMLLLAGLAGFGLSIAVGFATGGWATGTRVTMLARLAAHEARVDMAATACVNRFMAAPDPAGRLAALRRQPPWYRGIVLEDAGWATIAGVPDLVGSRQPVHGAAGRCADRLLAGPKPPG